MRGAPNIGVAGAYGLAVEAYRLSDSKLRSGLGRAAEVLAQARPTAVNLSWAIQRMQKVMDSPELSPQGLRLAVEREARRIESEEIVSSLAMACHGARLVKQGARVLTICNTGALAGPGMGTALGVVFQSHLNGKRPHVFACETRPLLQGARLTALELARARIPVVVIVDSAGATVMPECDVVLVGADRIARNGDTANKVGTKMLAVLAKEFRKPFYVVGPCSSFDLTCTRGCDIVIEERSADEVRKFGSCRAVPNSVSVFNPAFDITPARLITGFVTERGLIHPPFKKNIRYVLRTG